MASITINCDDSFKKKLTQQAQAQGLTLSAYIRRRLESKDYDPDVALRLSDIPDDLLKKLDEIAAAQGRPIGKVIVAFVGRLFDILGS